jgi:hypothetical protein
MANRNPANHNGNMFDKILPSWVESDPLRSRAVDALGLQAIADRLADRLLPGLSVLTTRARYLSFLCWARRKIGSDLNERAIHQWEVALALTEYRLHRPSEGSDDSESADDGAARCRFVGSRSIKQHFDRLVKRDLRREDPQEVYKAPAWRSYRPALVNLGLLEDGRQYGLTAEGTRVANAFGNAVHYCRSGICCLPESACLSGISKRERGLLRDRLGLSTKGLLPDEVDVDRYRRDRHCRVRFFRAMRRFLDYSELNPESVLPHYEKPAKYSHEEPAATLHAAAIWEHLSLGLNVVFCSWVQAVKQKNQRAFFRALAQSAKRRAGVATLGTTSLDDVDQAVRRARACLGRAERLRTNGCREGGNLLSENEDELSLGSEVLTVATPEGAERAIQRLLDIHRQAKGDEAWVSCSDSDLGHARLNRDTKKSWSPPDKVHLHPYRMRAFEQLVVDLR